MNKVHCSAAYHNLPFDVVESFALGVKDGYYGNNPPFTILPITEAAYDLLISTYVGKRADYNNGGASQKGPFLIAKTALMDATDLIAIETDKVAQGDSELIILAGFVPTKVPGESVKPGQTTVTVKRGIAGELISTCEKIENAKHYGCIMTEGAPLPDFAVVTGDGKIIFPIDGSPAPGGPVSVQFDFTDQREKHFTNLKHDVTYYFYYYVVNATGVGPLSEPVSIVCW